MASTVNTPRLDRSTSQSVRESDPSRQMSDEELPIGMDSKFYFESLVFLLTNNDLTVSRNSLKQIAKILQSIGKKPGDKKARQHPMQGIIIKKFVSGVQGGIDLMNTLGFQETTIDGKPYLQLADDHQTIVDADTIADVLIDVAAHPENILQKDKESTTTTAAAAGGSDTTTPPSTPDAKKDSTSADESTAMGDSTPLPVLCVKQCGFYGSAKTGGMCSLCFRKEDTPRKLAPVASTPITNKTLSRLTRKRPNTLKDKWARARTKLRVLYIMNSFRKPVQHDRSRCWSCNRKLNLSGVECRCGYVFCGRHRYAQEHNCTFDHYKRHQSNLAKSNAAIGRSKLEDDESFD